MSDNIKSWSYLPGEILTSIAERLYYIDQIRFRAVCKSWRSNIYPIKYADKLPWVMNNPCYSRRRRIDLYEPSQKQKFTVRSQIIFSYPDSFESNEYEEIDMDFSRHGWVLYSKTKISKLSYNINTGPFNYFFHNPFTNHIIELPELTNPLWEVIPDRNPGRPAFSMSPTSSDCLVFVLLVCDTKVRVSTCSPGDTTWNHLWFNCQLHPSGLHPVISDVAYINGVFYCTFNPSAKVMGAFDSKLQEWKTYPFPINFEPALFTSLIESQDEGNVLLHYFEYRRYHRCSAKRHYLFRFDQSQKEWSKVENLDNRMLFMGYPSISLPAMDEASVLQNTIHDNRLSPRFYDKVSEFSQNDCPDLIAEVYYDWIAKAREPGSGLIWIQPPQTR